MEGFGLQVILPIGFGALCAALAHSRGRTPVGWFFIGFFLSCIGLIIILVLPNVKEEEAKHAALDDANRSLRERLRQEQMKNEAFRQHAAQRLDAHDRQLDVDTRQTGDKIPIRRGRPDRGRRAGLVFCRERRSGGPAQPRGNGPADSERTPCPRDAGVVRRS
jgi:hypothetical protein